jgi:hypothetical protein
MPLHLYRTKSRKPLRQRLRHHELNIVVTFSELNDHRRRLAIEL